jgi:putative two-component system response regulator
MMPRMDAYTFLNALKAHQGAADIPVLLMSSKTSREEEHRALHAGFLDVIGKPVMPAQLLARIKRAFTAMETVPRRVMDRGTQVLTASPRPVVRRN